jgi:biopolymer transport protein ExbD
VDRDGNLQLNHVAVSVAALRSELEQQRRALGNTTTIIIQGDERVPHGQVVRVMDIARSVGLVDQVIATELKRE